jgi:hypothetical protein
MDEELEAKALLGPNIVRLNLRELPWMASLTDWLRLSMYMRRGVEASVRSSFLHGEVKAPFSWGPFATSLIDMNLTLETVESDERFQKFRLKGK